MGRSFVEADLWQTKVVPGKHLGKGHLSEAVHNKNKDLPWIYGRYHLGNLKDEKNSTKRDTNKNPAINRRTSLTDSIKEMNRVVVGDEFYLFFQ